MKYVTFAIMAVLIFGVAVSPVFSNGLAFAQTEKTEKEKKEQRSEDSKQKKAEQTAKAEERTQTSKEKKADSEYSDLKYKLDNYCDMTAQEKRQFHMDYPEVRMSDPKCDSSVEKKEISKEKHVEDSEAKQQKRQEQQEKRTAAQELQEQRKAELAERNKLLMDRLAEQERLDRERMQERLDRMDDRSPMNQAMSMLAEAGVLESTDSLTVTTDKASYSDGETILITGEVAQILGGYAIYHSVTAPNGNLVSIEQLTVDADKKFSNSLAAGGSLMKIEGTYTVTVQYGDNKNNSAITSFEFDGSTVTLTPEPITPLLVSPELDNSDVSEVIESYNQNPTSDKTGAYFDKLREAISEYKVQQEIILT